MSTEFIREIEEDIRRDRWKLLWNRYGLYVTVLAVVLVTAAAGWSIWRNREIARAETQTAALSALIDRAGNGEQGVADALASFARDADAGRAGIARFNEAAARSKAGDTAGAIAVWDELARTPDLGSAWRDLANLLSVLNQLYVGDAATLQARLAPMDTPANAYRFSAREMLAILAVRQNQPDRAKRIWEALTTDPETPDGIRTRAAELSAVHAQASR